MLHAIRNPSNSDGSDSSLVPQMSNPSMHSLQMGTARFDQRTVDRFRRAATRAAGLPPTLPEGWCRSPLDPGRIVAALPSLGIKDGFALRGYVFRSHGNGNGVVWAMPAGSGFLEPDDCPRMKGVFAEPPRPPGALDPMEAIDGDGTPLSYLSASLLARELREFGAEWHGCWWSDHEILCADPWGAGLPRRLIGQIGDPAGWEWAGPRPGDWRATVMADGGAREVVFHSYTGLERDRIFRHRDRYRDGSYAPAMGSRVIATGPGGYIH